MHIARLSGGPGAPSSERSITLRHSRATKLFALVGTAAVVGSLAPVGAQTVVAPRFKTERTYVHCGQTPKVQTIDSLQGRIPNWNTTAPTTSFQAGAGCGTFDPPVSTFGTAASALDDTSDLVWQGTFTGNIDSIVVHAHAIWMGPGKIKLNPQGADNPLMVWVWDATEVKSGLDFNGLADGPVITPAG